VWCELRRHFRNFRVDRMSKVEALPQTFPDEPGRTLADFLRKMQAQRAPLDCQTPEAMLMLDFLAEQEIAEAVSRGELDRLPGQGRGDAAARAKALKNLALLRTRIESRYYEQALRKLST
jgi:WYL domain/Domain of unknown function (DUF1992)